MHDQLRPRPPGTHRLRSPPQRLPCISAAVGRRHRAGAASLENRRIRRRRADRQHPYRGTPARSLVIQAEDQHHTFHTEFTVGRQGDLVIRDDFASSHHARFQIAHGLWFVEDLGSTNGTRLNGRRFMQPQRLKKGDKIRIGHTVMTVVSA